MFECLVIDYFDIHFFYNNSMPCQTPIGIWSGFFKKKLVVFLFFFATLKVIHGVYCRD